MKKISISTGHPDAGRIYAEAYDAALAREAALREELSKLADDYCEKVDDLVALQQRLTVAEQLAQKLVDCSKGQDSIATGYLSDILAALKPAAEGGRVVSLMGDTHTK